MKTAIVYDRVNKWGGAEQVLLTLHEMYPKAPLFTSVYNRQTAEWAKVFPEIHTSFLQKIPYAKSNHEYFAPLMPLAFETFNFENYDLVISVTSEAAKGIITKPSTKHICYCLTPTRYLCSGYDEYFNSGLFKSVSKPLVKYLKTWDKLAANRPDHIIAISSAVKNRVKKYYDRDSNIIYPPVDISKFQVTNNKSQKNSKLKIKRSKRDSSVLSDSQNDEVEDYYLIVSRLVSYKKVDLAIKAFNHLDKKLIIVGTGREENKLKEIANNNIVFKNFVSDRELIRLYQNAKGFIYPQEEDFGITAVEAQAAAVPVIAYHSGGVIDTVEDGITGIFFDEQEASALKEAVINFEKQKFSKENIVANAKKFSKEKFIDQFGRYVSKIVEN